jgi:energy-coupling factor transporter ATP-binding protein EcfA2
MTRDEEEAAPSASSPGHGAAVLVGRDRELARITAFLDLAAAEGGALLLTGDTGVGKTVLLDAAAAAAEAAGTRVLRVAGAEFGGETNFPGLSELLRPVLGDRRHLSELNQRALNVTLGLGGGSPPDRLVLANAVLALLRHVSAAGPVLVVADDLPWLDRPSALVLGLAARRLTGTRVGFLGAARPVEGGFWIPGERGDDISVGRARGHVISQMTTPAGRGRQAWSDDRYRSTISPGPFPTREEIRHGRR